MFAQRNEENENPKKKKDKSSILYGTKAGHQPAFASMCDGALARSLAGPPYNNWLISAICSICLNSIMLFVRIISDDWLWFHHRLQQCSLSPPRPAALSSYVRTQTHVCPSPIANSRFGSALFRVQRENSPFFCERSVLGLELLYCCSFLFVSLLVLAVRGVRRGVGSRELAVSMFECGFEA